MNKKIRVIVIGCGNMGASHARAYYKLEGFELVGLADRNPGKRNILAEEVGNPTQFDDFDTALNTIKPDAVSICTFPETHAEFTIKALKSGAHVFCKKTLAPNMFIYKKPPMTPEMLYPYIDEVAETGVTSFFMCPNYGCH